MSANSDEKLIASYLAGDEKSLETLIKCYLKPIYSFVYRYIGNSQEAEDITQEVFIKIWRNLRKSALSMPRGFDPQKGSFKTWIFSIAKNACIDTLKKKKTIPFSKFEDGEGRNVFLEKFVDTVPLPNELFEQVDIARILTLAIEKLLPKYRMVLFLRYNDHFNFREIAEVLEESINTIKTRHRRGIAILREILQDK
jgi:RNA polymerase sigma-70 factor (ECF subfamily)